MQAELTLLPCSAARPAGKKYRLAYRPTYWRLRMLPRDKGAPAM